MRSGNRKQQVKKTIPVAICMALLSATSLAFAQESDTDERNTREPVFRISKLNDAKDAKKAEDVFQPGALSGNHATSSSHSLDQAVQFARTSLQSMREDVVDYTAILVKREQVNGVVGEPGYIQLKVRCQRQTTQGKVPFSIYMKFLRPRESAGREVIWVEGQNENKIVAHETNGIARFRRFHLDPTGWLAMKGQRYPIYEAGLEKLVVKLIEKAERDRAAGPCGVDYREGAEINKRSCSVIEVTHDQRRAPYEFHKAQVFIDDELKLPIRYAAFDWPETPGATPKLLEEYTYINVKLNVGLTSMDFSPDNPTYAYPKK